MTGDPDGSGWRVRLHIEGPGAGSARVRCHLVVGFDRHPAGHAALRHALGLAGRLDAFVHVAHFIDTDDLPIDPDAADWDQAIAETAERERSDALRILDGTSTPWDYRCEPGQPARLLAELAEAHDAEMIVVGASRGGLAALLERFLGESVSATLAKRARRPVLIVPAGEPD